MRTSLRAAIAITVALGALIAASMASAAPPIQEVAPTTAPGSSGGSSGGSSMPGTPGMTCTIDHPDCNDSGLGGSLSDCPTDPVSSDPDSPVSSCVTDPTGGSEPTPSLVEPTPGMTDVTPTPFDTATIGDDDVTLTITFWSGVEPCAVLDHVETTYGADAVTVTVFEGSDPTAGLVACPEIAVYKQTAITLDEPLAGRAIVDGA